MKSKELPESADGVAVVGMALRFPGAANADEFWRNLLEGVESVSTFTDEELLGAGVPRAALSQPNYVRAKGSIEGEDLFDAPFFGFTPREAAVTDPQQRIFIECAWQALESAGYDPDQGRAAVGVFAGTAMSTYLFSLMTRRDIVETVGRYQLGIGNDKDHLPTMTSYKLNLKGPSVNVQTSCSTSLVAVHLACQSLLGGECDMALAGGVTVKVPQRSGYFYQEGGITSPDGHCRAFDARAQGTVGGSGCGVVALKRLEDAIADGDTIHAVIRGSAVNNDGSAKVGYTAPSVGGQAAAVREAIAIAGVEPGSIGYVEAHGTATPIGDPIEVRALSEAFGPEVARGSCALGSVKTNVGHLDTAAGVAGLIKAVLAVREGVIPPTLHFESPNPALRLSETPFFVNAEPREWPQTGGPRRAGVSSFGIGGTNAHVVLEEPPPAEASESRRAFHVLTLSARTEKALERAGAGLAAHLRSHGDLSLADVAYTLQLGRRAFKHRRAVVCRELSEAADALESPSKRRPAPGAPDEGARRVAFMFPGQGAQFVNMGLGLYRTEELFKRHLDECAEGLRAPLGADLRELLYPRGAADEAARRLSETAFTQPALFAVEYATARLYMSWGVRPSVMLGHSVGELVAACLAGVLSLEDALGLVAARGRLMQEMPTGAMMAVGLGEQETRSLIEGRPLSLAVINGPRQCVVSGEARAVDALEEELRGGETAHRRLQTSHAFHSPLMRPAAERFAELVARVSLKPPQTPYVSNVTGRRVEPSEATDPAYWAEHLCAPVRFDDGLRLLCESGDALLEVGPGRALSNLARELTASDKNRPPVVETLGPARDPEDEARGAAEALGALWANGARVSWPELHAGERRLRVPLPTYPFERQRHWIEPLAPQAETPAHDSGREESGAAVAQTNAPDAARAQEAQAMSADTTNVAPTPRHERLLEGLKVIINELTGVDTAEVDPHATYFEMGVSSLLLIQATRAVEQRFGVKVALMQLFDELKTLDILAAHLDSRMPPEEPEPVVAAVVPQAGAAAPSAPAADAAQAQPLYAPAAAPPFAMPAAPQGTLEHVVAQQLSLMAQQLELLRGGGRPAVAPPAAPVENVAQPNVAHANVAHGGGAQAQAANAQAAQARGANGNGANAPAPAKQEAARSEVYVPFQQAEVGPAGGLSGAQQRHLDELIARYTQRTRRSKELTQQGRRVLADPRTTAGFRRLWKEMLYPLVVERSQGARLWDVDGNEYVDITMGFGVHMFGHSPDFIREALAAQVERGIHLGPQSNLAGEVAALITELTGVERVTFSNSGTEAVMAALRVARSVTGRSKVAFFVGSYHGTFDGILARSGAMRGERRAVAMAPGVMPGMIEDVLVLDYGSEEALETIAKLKGELAAVLVEPVQSRRPEFQPVEYLRELRRLTEEGGAALIFDEVVTGFRVHPGGCQALFDIRADLVTYGKVIGGGLPVGVLAGRAEYMDSIDGGYWQYGDDSYPSASKTFFSGTFCKHPLTMASAHAALKRMKDEGPALQEALTRRATRLTTTLNDYFGREGLAFRVANFGSLLSFTPPRELKHAELFSYHLVEKGVYVWEGSTRYISTAHTDEDVDFIAAAVRESVEELRAGGFIAGGDPRPRPPAPGANGANGDGHTAAQSPAAAVAGGANGSAPAAAAEPGTAPLTEAQKQLWLMAQMGPEASRAYNESNSLRLRGELNVGAMTAAVQRLVARHEALRTNFSPEGDYQLIRPSLTIDVPFVDLSGLDPAARERRLSELTEELGGRVFDLTRDPLFRVQIVKLEEGLHQLDLAFHHIAVDGWSTNILFDELRSLYDSASQGKALELPPPTRYSDHANREAGEEQQSRRGASESYWAEQFADPVAVLELPTDRPRPTVQSYAGARAHRVFDASLCKDLKNLAGQNGCTMLMVVLAGFKLTLHRLTGQDDIVVGVPAAGQIASGDSTLFGHFVNMLPLRSRIADDPTVREFMVAVKRALLTGYEHQNYSFINLIKRLNLPRNPSWSPLFSVTFNFGQAKSGGAQNFGSLKAEVTSNDTGVAKFDLNLNVIERDGRLFLDLEYATALFDAQTVERWLGHYQSVLEAMASDSGQRVSGVSLLNPRERSHLLADLNRRRADFDAHRCLHELFEEQARRRPAAVALEMEGERVTYGELNTRANRLASYLRRRGVGAETRVGVVLERSLGMVVGILGVLKAGGAYVPLDAEYPAQRLSMMSEDASIKVLLTEKRHKGVVNVEGAEVVYLDADAAAIGEEGAEDVAGGASPDNVAYVIYTSGSTGAPKGVAVTHANVARLFAATQQWFSFNEDDVWTLFHSYAFDFSVWELWGALLYGGRLVVVPYFVSRTPEAFYELLLREKVTVLNQTPSAFRQLMQAEEKLASTQAPSLRLVIFGGEALALPSLREWVGRHGDERPQLVNMYGITETTVHVTYRRLRAADIEEAKGSLIGGPIPDLQAYVLDRRGQPLPVGVPGELYVGGAGLARGYLGRPALTAQRFVPNPFGVESGARLYRTGDRARYLPDGDLEYLGRVDHQVKIRGFRIELGEIEAALGKHPAIQEAVVTAREDVTGGKRLIGYMVARPPSPPPAVNELRAFLKESLPDYMIPAEFVTLDALPLTTNGKVNRQALPAPEASRGVRAESYVAPRTTDEETLAAIWADVLRREHVGVRDNFFELGGDSILAIQIVARAKEAGLQFSLRQLFQLQTVEELVNAAEPTAEGEPDSQGDAARPDSAGEKSAAPDGNDFGWSRDEFEDITSLLREHGNQA